jgi:hypothetical protein
MFSQPGVPITARAAAGLLVTRTRLRRWSRRAVFVITAVFALSVLTAPFVAALVLVIHTL